MTHVFHRNPKQTLPVAVGGKGIELFDSNGRAYLDASGGAAVSCLGHGHPRVIEAIKQQVDTLAYAHTSFFTTEVSETNRTASVPAQVRAALVSAVPTAAAACSACSRPSCRRTPSPSTPRASS